MNPTSKPETFKLEEREIRSLMRYIWQFIQACIIRNYTHSAVIKYSKTPLYRT